MPPICLIPTTRRNIRSCGRLSAFWRRLEWLPLLFYPCSRNLLHHFDKNIVRDVGSFFVAPLFFFFFFFFSFFFFFFFVTTNVYFFWFCLHSKDNQKSKAKEKKKKRKKKNEKARQRTS